MSSGVVGFADGDEGKKKEQEHIMLVLLEPDKAR